MRALQKHVKAKEELCYREKMIITKKTVDLLKVMYIVFVSFLNNQQNKPILIF